MDPFREAIDSAGVLPPAANPFRPGPGRVPPAFGGRTSPLLAAKTLVDQLAVPTTPLDVPVLRGFRGTGKTALMAYVRRHAAEAGAVTTHIEADASDQMLTSACATITRDVAWLTDTLPSRLGRRLAALDIRGRVEFHPVSERDPGANLEALLADVLHLAEETGRGLLLTVDEAHEAEELLLRPLARAVHRHGQDDRPLGVMIAGLPGVMDALSREKQTYTERLVSFDLGLLDLAGTTAALAPPFERDAGLTVTDEALALVHERSGGYPWFVQLWGRHLWDTLQLRADVDAAAIGLAAPRVEADTAQFHASRWRRVPDGRARDLVRTVAAAGGEAAIGRVAADLDLRGATALSPARATLIERGLLFAPSHGRIAFTVPGFDRWVLDHT